MLSQEKPQDFELIELLIRETAGVSQPGPSTSTQQKSDFESFKARFQSYIEQVPSYLHSVGKEGFFSHFFLGSFSILPDTQIAERLGVKKVYFRFDTAKTLKVVVVKNSQIKSDVDAIKGIELFSISEDGNSGHQFTSGELEYILKENLHPDTQQKIGTARGIKDRIKGRVKSKLVQINKNEENIFVETQDKEILDSAISHNFYEIKKEEEIWKDQNDNTKSKPEDYIAELTNSDASKVEESSKKVIDRISKVHSKYKGSFTYADKAREAAHHGFIAGALVNFRYRHNLRVYLEQFAGRGYADIVLVPRGKDRSLNAVPIIIELKAATKEELRELEKGGKVKDGSQTTPAIALEQAKDYAKGFQPNTMRVLTTSDNVLCVGLNLDSTEGEKFSMHISPREDREIALPTMQALLKEASDWDGRQDTVTNVKEKIKQPLERIYHTFPGTPEKGGNYFSRFLLGQLLLADKFKRADLKKFIFSYGEYSLASTTRSGKPVTTFALIREGRSKEVFIFHVREGGRGDRSSKKIPIPGDLPEQSKITEVYISLHEEKKSDFFNIEEVNRYNSLNEYKKGKEFFKGELKDVPYPNGLREAFDEALKSQVTPAAGQSLPVDKYNSLLKKVGEGMFSFRDFINEEAHFQGVLHGAFSYYSDLKLEESPRALVLTEFQTGRGKRIDMLVHGIKFAEGASNAKEYDPVGLELKGPREGKTADALVKEANDQINKEYVKGVTYKTLTDGRKVAFMGVVFDKGASNADSLILPSKNEFTPVKVVHSSIFSFSQCATRKRRDIGIPCIDSRDEEKVTKEEKKQRVKELFDIDNAKDLTNEIVDIGREQVFDMIGNADRTDVYVKVKDNNGNDKKLIIGDIIEMKNAERYFVDDYSDGIEILVKVGRDKDRVIKEKIKGQNIEYYLSIDGYEVKFDDIIKNFTTDAEREKIHNKLHQLSNDKQLLENKKYIEDIGDVQDVGTNQDYNDIVKEIKQNLLAKGVREDTFDRFKSHFDDLGEKVFADYISNVESSLKEKGIAFDRDKFDSAKIKGAKGGKFFSMMAIYDLLNSIGDTATLGRHNNDALKQVFGINGILDAMDDVRTSVSISPSSKVGKLIGKIPGPARQAFVKVISNPVVQSITFATIAYQFGYSINEIAQGNHHPLNYYWTASSGIKLASMSIRPISAGVSFTIKSVSATTKILRGLSAAGKVLGRVAVVTMVADVLITIGVEIHERIEYTKAIAEQVPLLPGGEQAEVFFAGVIKFFTGRNVEKEYEDKIRIKGYLNSVKEVAIKLLNDNYDIAAVVQYVISIEEKYSEVIKDKEVKPMCVMYPPDNPNIGEDLGCVERMVWICGLEKRYNSISFSKINTASNVKNDLYSLDISKILGMAPYTLVMNEGWERFICDIKNNHQCHQEIDEKKVYVVNTDAKHIPHLTKYEYENLGLRIVKVPLKYSRPKPQCGKVITTQYKNGNVYYPCNSNKVYRECQNTFVLSGEPFIFTNPTRKEHSNTKKQTFPRGSVLYISGPRTLTAAANYPAVMHIPEGSNIRYVGSKNNETIFIINDYTSGTLEGGAGKENTLVMNVKANNIVADLHGGTIRYGNSNNIRLVNTYNYVSNSDSKQNITTHCETRLINVKNAEVWQNSSNCTDKDYEVRVVNKENVHHRGLKQTIFVLNEDSDNAKIVSDLGSTGKIKGNIDIIRVQVSNITQWGISEDIEKGGYGLDLLADDTQSIVSSTKINDFKNLVIQVNCQGITESVTIQDKSLSDTIEDIRYQKLRNSGSDTDREIIQNNEKKLKAFIQASILDQELPSTYQVIKDIANNNSFNIPIFQIEVTKNHMGIPSEKVIIAGMYSDQVIVDFSYNNSDIKSSYQKYLNNGGRYDYDHYITSCNYYQDITVEGKKGQHQYIIKLPDTLNSEISSSPIRLNLRIKNKAAPYQSIPYDIIDFAELNVTDVDSINIQKGKRGYVNKCYNKSISDLTEDSLEIKDITVLGSEDTRWSLSIGLVDYFQSPEHQQIVLQMNNKLYKIDSTNSKLEHVEMDPNSFRYYQPDEQGLQIYHNQPINNNDIGLVDFRDKSILGFDAEVINDSLVLLHKNNTLIKVENWNTYQPAREMIFAFNDTILSNSKCIISTCNSEDIIGDLNKEKVVVLKNQMFNAIVQNNISEAEDLIRRIGNIDTENKHELTPLYVAIQEGRLDVVKLLFNRGSVNVKDKDIHGCNSLHWAAQEGKLNIAKLLVDKGANIIAEDNNGRTPLRIAACNGNLDVVKFFLNKSVDIESESNDPDKMMGKIESVRKEIINQEDASPNVKKWAKSFIEELRYSIKSKAKRKLDGNISSNCSASTTELTNRIYNFDKNLFDNITKEVVDDAYGRVDTKKILSCVRSHSYIGQLISGYVAVFDAMQKNGDLNDGVVFKLGHYIKETMEMKSYPKVPLEKRSDLEKLKNKLPESVRNAVFASKVCIKNIYQNEYLYAANNCFNYDNDRRSVFAWIPKNALNDKFKWKIKPDGDNFNIANAEFNENLYAASNYFNYDSDRRMVFTWVSGGGVARDVWMIKPYGNDCSIMNVELKEYLYAADYAKYDKDRRRIFTWIPGGQVSQGMWRIEDCGSNVRKVRDIVSNAKGELDQELLDAVKVGDMSKVRDSVNRGADINTKDKDGNTPSRNAVLKGHFGIFKYLVENGVSLEGKDHRCGPSICDASYSGNLDILKYLISKCVDINDTDKNGWTPLHFAAWRGYLEVANFLIEKGADINAENIFGRKPIHIAAENNNKDIIDFFLSKGMSIDDFDRYGRTPLYCASWNGHLGIVKYLVDRGADVYTQDKGGKTLLDIATDQKHNNIVEYLKQVQLDKELLIAAQYGNLSKVEDLVSQGASLSAKYSDGRTLMHCAAYGGELNVVKYLVVGEKSSLKIKDNSGRIPLHYAAYNGKLDIVKYFIDEEKIDVNIKDHGGWAPLYYASCSGYSNVVNYLDKIHNLDLISNLQENSASLEIPNSNNIEVQDKLGRTPLHLAAKAGDLSKINLLCDYGANIEAQDNFGCTPIFFAIRSGKLNVVSLVLYYGANINAQDMYGSTPLHYAAQEGNLGMIQLLLSRCARIELLDRNGWTPILFAARESKWNAVELLVSKGAKFNNEITYQGTPLHFAVREGNLDTVKFLIDKGANIESQDDYNNKPLHLAVRVNRLDIVKFLLDKHANIEAKDMDGDIPLELAIQSGYKDIEEVLRQAQLDLDKELLNAAKSGDLDKVKECIKRGAYIDTKSSNGRTSLHWAAVEGCLPGVEYLIKGVADINAKDNISRTPLHYAARNGHLDVVKYFIEEDADFEVKDKNDKTPLDLASWQKHDDVVKYLEEIKEEREKPVQRKRRHHHGDHSRHHNHLSRKPLAIDLGDQPEIATSSGARPPSWINDLFGWIKGSVGGLFYSRAALSEEASNTASSIPQVDEQFAKASVSSSSSTSTTLPSDGTDKKQENGGFFRDNIDYVNANIKQMRERQTPVKFKPSGGNTILEMGDHYLSQVDFNGTIMLLDLLIRKVTGQKYISTVDQSISPLEAQGYALNITKGFERVVEQAGLKSDVSMHRLNIDYVRMQEEIAEKVMSGKFNEISGILNSYVEKACPGREAGCPGKLSPKKFDKFMIQFNSRLNIVLNQSIEQILHNRDGRLEVDDAKQMSLEPQSYLSNASVHSHSEVSTCLSEIGVTKLGGNLNR